MNLCFWICRSLRFSCSISKSSHKNLSKLHSSFSTVTKCSMKYSITDGIFSSLMQEAEMWQSQNTKLQSQKRCGFLINTKSKFSTGQEMTKVRCYSCESMNPSLLLLENSFSPSPFRIFGIFHVSSRRLLCKFSK